MQNMSTIQGNLNALAREYDGAQKKAEKLNQRGGRTAAGKVAGASEDIDTATAQWDSQAPYVFEQLQAVDESRLNHLRDVLTLLQTHEVDQVERHRVAAEQCLNALLNVNTADDIQAFSARNSGPAARTSSRTERLEPTTSRTERHLSRAMLPPSNTNLIPPQNGESAAAVRAPSPRAQSPQEEKKKPSGLRRLGTVFNKRRQSVMPGFSRPSVGRTKSATRLGSDADLTEASIPEMPTNTRLEEPPSRAQEMRESSPAPQSRPSEPSEPVGLDRRETMRRDSSQSYPTRSSSNRGLANGTHQETLAQLQQPLQPAAPASAESANVDAVQPERDEEGYSTRAPLNDPITQAQQEATMFEGGENANSQFKLDIRNAPIAEEGSSADQAMASVANTLRAQAAPARRMGTLRGRRDVRNTVFIPSDTAPVFHDATTAPAPSFSVLGSLPAPAASLNSMAPQSNTMTPPLGTTHHQLGSDDHTSDTQSVRSARSLGSTISGAAGMPKHPDMKSPGLSSSIIETVTATIDKGSIVRCSVQGELAFAHSPDFAASTNSSTNRATIRLDNFPTLEKVAPNPSFINQLNPGEYSVDLSAMNFSTGAPMQATGRPAIAFKYKLHVDPTSPDSMARHCPLILTPSWRCELGQSSVILSYALNPAYSALELTLNNVVLVLHLEGARATACQSKPAGTFSKREGLIYWRFEEMRLSSSAGGVGSQKVIARFANDGTAAGGRCEARWEVGGGGSQGGDALGVSRLEGGGGSGAGKGGSSDPFADEDGAGVGGTRGSWMPVGGVRRAVAGTYVAT